jgi:LysM repeat protein
MATLTRDPISNAYIVAPHDTLSKIASTQGITLASLLASNPQYASNPNLIHPGDAIKFGASTVPSYSNLTSGQSSSGSSSGGYVPPTISFTDALIKMLKDAQQRDVTGQAGLMKQSQSITGLGLNDASAAFKNPLLAPNSGTSLGLSAQNEFDPLTLSIANQQKLATQNLGNITDLIKQTSYDYQKEEDRRIEATKNLETIRHNKADESTARIKANSNDGSEEKGTTGVIDTDVQAILEGRNTMYNIRQTMGRTNAAAAYMQQVREKITKIDPKFDFVASDAGGKSVSTSYVQRATASINAVLPNINTIIELSNQVPRVGITGVDKLVQKANLVINNKKVASLHEAQKLIADEIGIALGAGTVSDMKLQLGFDVTNPNVSADVFASNMKLVKEFLNNRKDGLNSLRYTSSTTNANFGGNTPTSERKTINGAEYEKVNGGWQKVSFNSVGSDTNKASNIAQRNNNPLNIKASSLTQSFPGVIGVADKARDGGNFLSFASPTAGFNAARQLITSSIYSNLSVDQALRKWSNA